MGGSNNCIVINNKDQNESDQYVFLGRTRKSYYVIEAYENKTSKVITYGIWMEITMLT